MIGCEICGAIPESLGIYNDWGERFPDPVERLVRLVGYDDEQIWRCPACGALFFWNYFREYPGGHDEEYLRRIPEEVQRQLVPILALAECPRGKGLGKLMLPILSNDQAPPRTWHWDPGTPRDWLAAALQFLLCQGNDLSEAVTVLVEDLKKTNDGRLHTVIESILAKDPAQARQICAQLQGEPLAGFSLLLFKRCKHR